MPVSNDIRRAGPFLGDDSATEFPFDFRVFSADEVFCAITTPLGVEIPLTLHDDYTVTLSESQEESPGGTITLVSPATPSLLNTLPHPLPTGYKLAATSLVPEDQQVDLHNLGGFFPSTITRALDKLTILVQQLSLTLARVIKVPLSGETFDDLIAQLTGSVLSAETSAQASADSADASANSASEASGYADDAKQYRDDLLDASDQDDPAKGSGLVGHNGSTVRQELLWMDGAIGGILDLDADGGGPVYITGGQAGYAGYLITNTGVDTAITLDPAERWPVEATFINFSVNPISVMFDESELDPIVIDPAGILYATLVPFHQHMIDRHAGYAMDSQLGTRIAGITAETDIGFVVGPEHIGHLIECNNVAGVEVFFEEDDGIPILSTITVCKSGGDPVTFDHDVGVTILKRASLTLEITEDGDSLAFVKVAADTWRCIG